MTHQSPSTRLVTVGHRLDGEPIVEEHIAPGMSRVFVGDPRYCALDVPHIGHEFHYEYVRPADHGGLTQGHYYCNGDASRLATNAPPGHSDEAS